MGKNNHKRFDERIFQLIFKLREFLKLQNSFGRSLCKLLLLEHLNLGNVESFWSVLAFSFVCRHFLLRCVEILQRLVKLFNDFYFLIIKNYLMKRNNLKQGASSFQSKVRFPLFRNYQVQNIKNGFRIDHASCFQLWMLKTVLVDDVQKVHLDIFLCRIF